MVIWRVSRQHVTWLCAGMLLIFGGSGAADELLSLHLNRVAHGQFPAQHWYPADRPAIKNESESMLELLETLSLLDEDAMNEIKLAHADRSVFVHDLKLENLRARIDQICEIHRPILNQLKRIQWSDASEEMVPLEIIDKRYQIQTLAYLVHLDSVRDFAEGRVESASQTLAGGYAFAHNLMRTSGDLNLVLGITLQSVMTKAFGDMQSLGAPDMQTVLSRIDASQMDQANLDRAQWMNVCQSMPVLIDRERNPKDWQTDLEATLRTFRRADLTPRSPDEAEQLGRQIQTLVQTLDRVKALNIVVKYEYGGMTEARTLEPGQLLVQTTTMNLPALAKYVDETLDNRIIDRAQNDLGRRLWGLKCVEWLRLESFKQGRWITRLDTAHLDAVPSRTGSSLRPTINIMNGLNQLPAYEIRFPEEDFPSGSFRSVDNAPMIAVSIKQEFPQ